MEYFYIILGIFLSLIVVGTIVTVILLNNKKTIPTTKIADIVQPIETIKIADIPLPIPPTKFKKLIKYVSIRSFAKLIKQQIDNGHVKKIYNTFPEVKVNGVTNNELLLIVNEVGLVITIGTN